MCARLFDVVMCMYTRLHVYVSGCEHAGERGERPPTGTHAVSFSRLLQFGRPLLALVKRASDIRPITSVHVSRASCVVIKDLFYLISLVSAVIYSPIYNRLWAQIAPAQCNKVKVNKTRKRKTESVSAVSQRSNGHHD